MPTTQLIITCEHGGNAVPPAYAPLFTGHAGLLQSHRGWDPGALPLAQQMADAMHAPLFAATTTRLLIDLNRSIGHKALHSEATRHLSLAERRKIAALHYKPHRDLVEADVARRIDAGERVLHIASHSFTPELNGQVRQADVAWLYDPRRPGEGVFAAAWQAALQVIRPDFQLRRNYPYHGKDDGLTSLLRKRHSPELYIGIELELNQKYFLAGGDAWNDLCDDVTASLARAFNAVYGS